MRTRDDILHAMRNPLTAGGLVAIAKGVVDDAIAHLEHDAIELTRLTAEVERLKAERDAAASVVAWARNHLFWIGQERTYTESETKLAAAIRKLEDGSHD